jgi:hypothetical protein
MTGLDAPLASGFLFVTATLFLVAFALPLLFCPLRWARWFRWQVPAGRNDLCVYFGRCLGAVALAAVLSIFRAARDPRAHRDVLDLIILIGVPMIGVHAWGALRRQQPWTETVEIVLYAAVTAATVAIRLASS